MIYEKIGNAYIIKEFFMNKKGLFFILAYIAAMPYAHGSAPAQSFVLPKRFMYSNPKTLSAWPKENELAPMETIHEATHQQLSISDDQMKVVLKDTRSQQKVHELEVGNRFSVASAALDLKQRFSKAFFSLDGSMIMAKEHALIKEPVAHFWGCEKSAARFVAFDAQTGESAWISSFNEKEEGIDARFMHQNKIVVRHKNPTNEKEEVVITYDPADHEFKSTTPEQQTCITCIGQLREPHKRYSLYLTDFSPRRSLIKQSLEKDFTPSQQKTILAICAFGKNRPREK